MLFVPTTGVKNNFGEVEVRIKSTKEMSRWIQVDVCDGEFAPGKTFELELLNKLDFDADNILWDIHLMVKEPINWIEKCIHVGACRIIGQVEMMENLQKFVDKVISEGMDVGIGYDIGTEIGEIPKEVDEVLLMGRKAGFGAYPLDKRVIEKIREVKEVKEKREKKFVIAIDGGVGEEDLNDLEVAGADMIYLGNNYFEIMENVK